MSGLALKSQKSWWTARNHVVRVVRPIFLTDVSEAAIGALTVDLRTREVEETTIACYLRTIAAALNWAVDTGKMLSFAPDIQPPKRAKGKTKTMRGRPLTLEDHEKMLAAVDKVRKRDGARWQNLLTGLWLSGLRIGEIISLSWDAHAGFCIFDTHPYPLYRIFAESEKGHRDRYLPVAPEFCAWLGDIPESRRRGPVFGIRLSSKRVSAVISSIGAAAGVIVDGNGKPGSAHDYRRAFGSRWASRIAPAELQQLMRHESIETTMKYYVHIDAMSLSEKLWRAMGGAMGGDAQSVNGGIDYQRTAKSRSDNDL
jgi:integrase